MNRRLRHTLIAWLLLALVHTAVWLLPGPGLGGSMQMALFAANAYVIFCVLALVERGPSRRLGFFVIGYVLLYLLVMVALGRSALFILLVVLYASVFSSPVLLGGFAIFVLCFVVLQPYAFASFVPLIAVYVIVVRARRRADALITAFLTIGLLGLGLLLFPLIHLMMQDSVQTLWHAMQRDEMRWALWLSLSSAGLSTLGIAVWGTPLAYALARHDFAGKRLIETLIDLPILVPQSVAGIALMVLLGPGSPVGAALEHVLGLRIAGSVVGIVLAQSFVAAPFYIKAALAAFESVPIRLEQASRVLGATAWGTLWRISLPLAARGLLMGGVLAFARALSELGALLLIAASPQTAPVLVHVEFLRVGASESRPLATLFLLVCLWSFALLQMGGVYLPRVLQRRGER